MRLHHSEAGHAGGCGRDQGVLQRPDRALQIPRYIRFVESFPMTVTGKIQKFLLRKQAATDLGLAAE
jgi:acyl-coenzyme A synthetase/AMP-(fatty) acid ligase